MLFYKLEHDMVIMFWWFIIWFFAFQETEGKSERKETRKIIPIFIIFYFAKLH